MQFVQDATFEAAAGRILANRQHRPESDV